MNIYGGPITGTLPSGGTLAVPVAPGGAPPYSFQLSSTNASRAVSVSMEGGTTAHFVAVSFTVSTTAAGIVEFNSPVAQVLFAGAAGDAYTVL